MSTFTDPWLLFSRSLTDHAADVAVIDSDDREITYGDLHRGALTLSSDLADTTPVQSGVAVLLGMLPEFFVSDLAILHSGMVKVPLNPMLSGAEMAYIIDHSRTAVLLTSSQLSADYRAKVDKIAASCPDVRIIDVSLDGLLDCSVPQNVTPADLPGDARAALYYTGGTTGMPKGVVHTRAGVAATVIAHVIEAEITSGTTLLLSTALSHSAGSFAGASMARGARTVLLDKFTPEAFGAAVERHDVNFAMVVPTMLYRLLDHVAAGNPAPALETLVYGSAPITPSRLWEAVEVFGPVLIQLFGQTECPNWGTVLSKADHAKALVDATILTSCGKRTLLADVRVVGEDGQPLDPGQIGEICLTAPFQMKEYLDNPEATTKTLVDGWVHTGDIGEWDDRGYLYVRDRKNDMIITGGYNVYSSEVEAEIQKIAGVGQVAVVGIPDDDWGEAVCAVIERAPNAAGAALDEDALLTEARTLLGNYKRPKRIEFIDEMPLTPFGKSDKKSLRAPFWADRERSI